MTIPGNRSLPVTQRFGGDLQANCSDVY